MRQQKHESYLLRLLQLDLQQSSIPLDPNTLWLGTFLSYSGFSFIGMTSITLSSIRLVDPFQKRINSNRQPPALRHQLFALKMVRTKELLRLLSCSTVVHTDSSILESMKKPDNNSIMEVNWHVRAVRMTMWAENLPKARWTHYELSCSAS